MKHLSIFLLVWAGTLPAGCAAPDPLTAMRIEGQIRIQFDAYEVDEVYAPYERVAMRRVQNDLMMVDTKLTPEPYVERVRRLMEDWGALVRLDLTLEHEDRI